MRQPTRLMQKAWLETRPRKENAPDPSRLPFVSVIVPVYNNLRGLRACLRGLREQTYRSDRFEVIVVDNGSTRSLASVEKEFPEIRLLREERRGSYVARNTGLAHAKGDVIAFTDSDCTPRRTWLEEGVAALGSFPGCGLVGGVVDFTFKVRGKRSTCELYDSLFYFDQADYVRRGRFACTANAFTYARVIREVGQFDATLKSGGDRDLGNRIAAAGYRVELAEKAVVLHPARSSMKALVRKRRRLAGGHHHVARRKGLVPLRFLNAMWRHLVRDPAMQLPELLSDPRALAMGTRLKIFGVYVFLSYAEAVERARLLLGGRVRR